MNKKHVELLLSGVGQWNEWRRDNPLIRPDLAGAVLAGAVLPDADLQGANLERADLRHTYLAGAYLMDANLADTKMRNAHLMGAILTGADLTNAILRDSFLTGVDFTGANLRGAILNDARLWRVTFTDVTMNWFSHILIGTRLMQHAGDDYDRRTLSAGIMVAGSDYCWGYWLANTPTDVKEWALNLMATWVRDGDNAPKALTERVKAQSEREE